MYCNSTFTAIGDPDAIISALISNSEHENVKADFSSSVDVIAPVPSQTKLENTDVS